MDPKATWRDILAALNNGDTETAWELANSLLQWARKGGDMSELPVTTKGITMLAGLLALWLQTRGD